MQNIFQPHPFSTAVGTLTERATDSGQPSEDWALILEICDTVNETDDGPKEAIRAIKKRLVTSAGKDNVSIWYTLTLLETLVRNCGRRFHSQVANKEFLHAFLKLLSPKNDPPQQLQTKVLYMLKCWISSNWDVPGKRDLDKVYASLLQKGVQFPSVAPSECDLPKSSRSLSSHDNPVILKCDTVISPTGLKERDKPISRTQVVRSSGTESDVYLRNRLAVDPTNSINIIHPCSVCHCVHNTNSQSNSCSKHRSCFNIHLSHDSTGVSSNQHTRNVHFNPIVTTATTTATATVQNRIQTSVPVSDCRIMVANSGIQHPLTVNQHRLHSSGYQMNNPLISVNHDEMEFDEDGIIRHLNTIQRIKLTEDLGVVETNINVLNDLLAELRPDTVTSDDLNLLRELNDTCRAMHLRVMEFLSQVSDEEVTPSLIQVNDNLTHTLSRYDRFERYYQRSLQNSDDHSTVNHLNSSQPQLCLTGPSGSNTVARHNQSNRQRQQQQQLAITVGPSSSLRSTGNQSVTNCIVTGCHRINGVQRNREAINNNNNAVDDDDDDDESLLDIREEPSRTTSRSHDSDETDEIAQWLSSRQLILVGVDEQQHHHQSVQQQSMGEIQSDNHPHYCIMSVNQSTVAVPTTTTSGALITSTHLQNTSNKSIQSNQSFNALL
ncbi:unnamed protein product [Heterobilharzia americana]|nr:unnamed protein product [Heterobilharzia americana]